MAMVQIRNVPTEIHIELKIRAAKAGMTLSDFLLRELEHLVEKPTLEEMYERLSKRQRDFGDLKIADVIREDRDSR